MTWQRFLLRFGSARWLGRAGQRWLRQRVWTIEGGEGARLQLAFPQNHDYILGTSELPVQRALVRHLRPGSVFYDIGANMGFFSLIAARQVGAAGSVYAFEPVAENAAAVRRNARLNQFGHLTVWELAVGRCSGTAEMLLTDWDGGGLLCTSAVQPAGAVAKRTVRVAALDDLIPAENLRRPDLVKIDVEGVELDVIEGMTRTLVTARPVLLYEVDDGDVVAFDRRWRELDEKVAALGYEIVHLENSYPHIKWNVGHTLALPRADGPNATH